MLTAYAKNPGAYHQALIGCGDSQNLLRRAAAAIEETGADDGKEGSGPTSDDEIKVLIHFAESVGLFLDAAKMRQFMLRNAMRSGSEHKVAHDVNENRVIKDLNSRAIATESLFDYLTDHLLSNYFFHDDVKLEGFYQEENHLHIVVSQPYVDGIHPDWETLKTGLEAQGLKHESPASKIPSFIIENTPAGIICINDLHENNVILGSVSRLMHPIDAHFYFDDRAARILALNLLEIRRGIL
ncbi:MAG: hypothetical protein V4599_03170 [Verrucomicrobiota bacterium]